MRHRGVLALVATALVTSAAAAACGDDPVSPGMLRFGQIGEVRLSVTAPLGVDGNGELQQVVSWNSGGPWQVTETVRYRGRVGDDHTVRSTLNPEVLAGTYAQWIAQVNDVQGLTLFDGTLDPDLDPQCGELRTRVTLRVRDEARDREVGWTRCATGTLGTLSPGDAGPDFEAGRLVQAAVLLRFYTLGEDFLSQYHASAPFGTLARRDDGAAPVLNHRIIRTDSAFADFWAQYVGDPERPAVDFDEDVVLVAAVGMRDEAGDSVEVRRVLPVDMATYVEQVLRVPGDFCSPASDRHTPFHVIVTPAVPEPVYFQEARVERVPCGA